MSISGGCLFIAFHFRKRMISSSAAGGGRNRWIGYQIICIERDDTAKKMEFWICGVDKWKAPSYNRGNNRNLWVRVVAGQDVFSESRMRWNCGKRSHGEWTYEGGANGSVPSSLRRGLCPLSVERISNGYVRKEGAKASIWVVPQEQTLLSLSNRGQGLFLLSNRRWGVCRMAGGSAEPIKNSSEIILK